MEFIQQDPELSAYLAADDAIDHEHPVVREVAADLARRAADSYVYARAAYVRP
jgi:transglutaminase-like putative cysteine protease